MAGTSMSPVITLCLLTKTEALCSIHIVVYHVCTHNHWLMIKIQVRSSQLCFTVAKQLHYSIFRTFQAFYFHNQATVKQSYQDYGI